MQYFDLIFTLHAQKKMAERGIKIADAYETFKHPTKSGKGKYKGTIEFEREFDNFKISLAATQNLHNEWVVKSVWRNPPLPGNADSKQKETWKKMNKTGFWGKIYLTIKQQLGIT